MLLPLGSTLQTTCSSSICPANQAQKQAAQISLSATDMHFNLSRSQHPQLKLLPLLKAAKAAAQPNQRNARAQISDRLLLSLAHDALCSAALRR
jgi:hypothetical protein